MGLEIRENRISARAAAYQELGVAVADNWMGRANNRELDDLVFIAATADSATWADLDASDVYLLRSQIGPPEPVQGICVEELLLNL